MNTILCTGVSLQPAMASTPDMITNETLCYCKNKFEIATNKQLKIVLGSFYNEDELSFAKQLLHDHSSKVINNLPRLIKRNKSENKCKLIVENIMDNLTRIDEEKCWDQMPMFLALNLSRIPIIPIEDMETFIMAQKIEQLEASVRKVEVDKVTLSKHRA